MQKMPPVDFFEFNSRFFHYTGLLLLGKPKFSSVLSRRAWYLCKWFIDTVDLSLTVSCTLALATTYNNLGEFSATLMAVVYCFNFYLRSYAIFYQKQDNVRRLIRHLNSVLNENLIMRTPEEIADFNDIYRTDKKFISTTALYRTGTEFVAAILCCFIMAIQGVFGASTRIPSYGWFPVDHGAQPANFLICIYQAVGFSSLVVRLSCIDTFVFTAMMLVSTELRFLGHGLTRVFKRDIPTGTRLQLWRAWIINRQRVIRITDELKLIVEPYLAISYIIILTGILTCGIALITESWEMSQKVLLMAVNIILGYQLLIICRVGDVLQDMEKSVTDGGYCPDMMYCSRELLTSFRIAITRSQRVTRLSAYGFHPLSSATFGTLLRATFSYYLAIIQIAHHKGFSRNPVL